jgi:hypothetical protein
MADKERRRHYLSERVSRSWDPSMKGFVLVTCLAFAATAFAGCLEDKAALGLDQASNEAPAIAIDESLRIDAKDCIQAGGNSVYPGQMGKVGPFDAADQTPEIGKPTIGAFGMPVTGPASGIWHVTTLCKSYTYKGEEHQNFAMGWIAEMIERPDFDTWGEPRIQFIVADLSFNVEDYVAATKEATRGAEISPATENLIEWYVPEKYMHVVISEASHGTFDFTAELHKEFAKKETEHIRFWMLPRSDGMGHSHCEATCSADDEVVKYRPISIDIFDTATGGGKKLAGESVGTFIHIQDVSDPTSNHPGNPLGHFQDGFDRTIVIGLAPEGIEYDRTWVH